MCLLQEVRLNPKMVLGLAEVPEFFIIFEILLLLTDIYFGRYIYWVQVPFLNCTFIVYKDRKIVIWWNLYYLMKKHQQWKVRYL